MERNNTSTRNLDAMFLGTLLRRAREARGLSQEGLAERWGYERTVIAKTESGYRPMTPELAKAYAKEFPELNNLIESGLIEQWAEHVRTHSKLNPPRFFADWLVHEEAAIALFYWAPLLVPGCLQTERYARAILGVDTDAREPLDERVRLRMDRQQKLFHSNPPPMLSAVLSEAVLRQNVGGPEVMHEQLMFLAEIGQQPTVCIQVIPASVGAHAGLGGPASIADLEEGPTVVHLSTLSGGETTGELEAVARVRRITDALRAEALPRGASGELILRLAEEVHGRHQLAEEQL